MKKIKCIMFDFGGVIGKPQDDRYVDDMEGILDKDKTLWIGKYHKYREDYHKGTMEVREYWEKVTEDLGLTLSDDMIDNLNLADSKSWTQINQDSLDWIHSLCKDNVILVLLSNISEAVLKYMKENFQWLEDFDHLFFSCEMKMLKPDSEIYEAALKKVGEDPDECLFIDDSIQNVKGAKRAGMESIRFTTFEETKKVILENYDIEGRDLEDVIGMV